MKTYQLIRKPRGVQPYPRNGNVGQQKPLMEWWIVDSNGRGYGIFQRLRDAQELLRMLEDATKQGAQT